MKTNLFIAVLFALNLGVPAARASEQDGAEAVKPQGGTSRVVMLNATVTAIDQAAREVTLTDAEGNSEVLSVGEEVKNLPQVEVGDRVDVTSVESVNFEVLQPGEAKAKLAALSVVGSAEPGQKPAAAATHELSFVATVEAIDKGAETVVLKGPGGNVKAIKVRNPDNLEKVAVGDELLITVTRSVAVRVSASTSGD